MLGLTFAAPFALAALIGLPALWLLLRVTPPRPRRIDFPPLKLVADLAAQRQTPARTPPWLLILRVLAAAALILAVSGPVWNPSGVGAGGGRKALLVMVDNGVSAAHDWRDRMRVATDAVEGAARDGRPVAVVGLADAAAAIEARTPAASLERLRALAPRPYLADRDAHLQVLAGFLERNAGAGIVWISDGVAGIEPAGFPGRLAELGASSGAALTILRAETPPALALTASETGGKLTARVLRAAAN
ncbi:LytTR family transcriptional regulator, partial [Methylobacterium sp. WL93]